MTVTALSYNNIGWLAKNICSKNKYTRELNSLI